MGVWMKLLRVEPRMGTHREKASRRPGPEKASGRISVMNSCAAFKTHFK